MKQNEISKKDFLMQGIAIKNSFGFGKTVAFSCEKIREQVTNRAEKEGLGILAEIGIASKTKSKSQNLFVPCSA